MKLALSTFLVLISFLCQAQEIIGKWQLTKQSTCMDDGLPTTDAEEEMLDDMNSMSGTTPQVLHLKENNTAVETTKIINRRKAYNANNLLYKFTGSTLHFLDKRSRTIVESFNVEKITADSLIISNAARACETKVFVKINHSKGMN
jgi:hypothetical protein